MTMPKGWTPPKKVEPTEYEIKEQKRKASLFESRNKKKWNEIERELTQRKEAGEWLDHYDIQKLKEAEIRRKTNNYSPEPIVLQRSKYSSSNNNNKGHISERGKDNLFLGLVLAFILSCVPAIVIGTHYMNWPAIIFGLIILFGLAILGGIYGSRRGHDNGYYYYAAGAASGAGRGFRMWAANRATRKRG